jgi:hypothetical protein
MDTAGEIKDVGERCWSLAAARSLVYVLTPTFYSILPFPCACTKIISDDTQDAHNLLQEVADMAG